MHHAELGVSVQRGCHRRLGRDTDRAVLRTVGAGAAARISEPRAQRQVLSEAGAEAGPGRRGRLVLRVMKFGEASVQEWDAWDGCLMPRDQGL